MRARGVRGLALIFLAAVVATIAGCGDSSDASAPSNTDQRSSNTPAITERWDRLRPPPGSAGSGLRFAAATHRGQLVVAVVSADRRDIAQVRFFARTDRGWSAPLGKRSLRTDPAVKLHLASIGGQLCTTTTGPRSGVRAWCLQRGRWRSLGLAVPKQPEPITSYILGNAGGLVVAYVTRRGQQPDLAAVRREPNGWRAVAGSVADPALSSAGSGPAVPVQNSPQPCLFLRGQAEPGPASPSALHIRCLESTGWTTTAREPTDSRPGLRQPVDALFTANGYYTALLDQSGSFLVNKQLGGLSEPTPLGAQASEQIQPQGTLAAADDLVFAAVSIAAGRGPGARTQLRAGALNLRDGQSTPINPPLLRVPGAPLVAGQLLRAGPFLYAVHTGDRGDLAVARVRLP